MDKLATKLADILGSTPVILGYGLWLVYHNVTSHNYVAFISDLAIWIGLLILRAEDVQAHRMERYVKLDLKKSDKAIALLHGNSKNSDSDRV